MDENVKKIVIEIETENAAFKDGNCGNQVQYILEKIINNLVANDDIISTMNKCYADINGNTCCHIIVEKE